MKLGLGILTTLTIVGALLLLLYIFLGTKYLENKQDQKLMIIFETVSFIVCLWAVVIFIILVETKLRLT